MYLYIFEWTCSVLSFAVDAVGLPLFHHVLTPRSKGLWLCTERLRACTDAFYDVTIAYSSTLQSTSNDNLTIRAAAPSLRGILSCQLCMFMTCRCTWFVFSECSDGRWFWLWIFSDSTTKCVGDVSCSGWCWWSVFCPSVRILCHFAGTLDQHTIPSIVLNKSPWCSMGRGDLELGALTWNLHCSLHPNQYRSST